VPPSPSTPLSPSANSERLKVSESPPRTTRVAFRTFLFRFRTFFCTWSSGSTPGKGGTDPSLTGTANSHVSTARAAGSVTLVPAPPFPGVPHFSLGHFAFAVFPHRYSETVTPPQRRVHIDVHGHSVGVSVSQRRYSRHGAFRTAMLRLLRGYMCATHSVRVRRAVCMRLLGVRGTVSLLLLRLGRLARGEGAGGITTGKGGAESTSVGSQLVW
jgi:hypothetical protein